MEQQTVPAAAAPRHRPYEDLQALLTGTLLTAFGIVLLQQAGLVSGGTVGLALLLHYATGVELGLALLVVNAPFYLLAWRRMGRAFTFKTLAAVSLLAAFVWLLPRGLQIGHVAPVYGAVLGGLLTGVGLLVLFRHRASLGGFNVLALYAQQKLGWRAGAVQMALDATVVLGAGLAVGPAALPASVLAVVVLNAVLAINHRPGRYTA